jgi:hypothetical protein
MGNKDYNFKHEQHTAVFKKELNSPKNHLTPPYRYSDERWVVGKHKGKKIDETPVEYIKWSLNYMQLSKESTAFLENKLKNRIYEK